MARRYVRDAKGRFASKGYSGQSGGRGARLKSGKGNTRSGGGKRENLIGANDQTMTSLPKGTIGRNSRTRNMARVDMLGSGKGATFDKVKQAQKASIRARKNSPREMSKEEFARRTGGKTRADSMGLAIEQSRQPHGRTKAGDRRNEARLRQTQDQVRSTDAAYDAAIKSGKIKAPTNSLARKAAGDPNNPAVQAAKRLKAKTAAKRAQLSSQQKRDIKAQQIEASRSASRNSARMGNTGNTPAQSAAYAKAAKADRARANAFGEKLEGQSAPPTVFARSSRIKGQEIGGRYKGKGKTSLYGKDLASVSAARPGSTIKKPAKLKPGALSPKPAAKPASRVKKSKAQRDIESAQRRLKTKQYGYTASQGQALLADRRLAKMTPLQLASSRVRTMRYSAQRTQRSLRQGKAEGVDASWVAGMERSLNQKRADFKKAAADYRTLKPRRKRK